MSTLFNFNQIYLFYLLVGVSAAMFAEGAYLLLYGQTSYRKNINRRLQVIDDKTDRESVLVQLRRERGLTSGGEYRLPLINLNQLLLQSGLTLGFGRLVVFIVIGMVATFAGLLVFERVLSHAVMGALFAGLVLPFLVLKLLRWRRQRKFSAQFPDAIDIIVRSLRAGHPVPIAINMVAREMPDPAGSEFGIVVRRDHLWRRPGNGDAQPLLPRRHRRPAAVRHRGGDPGLDRRQSRRNPGKPVGGDPPALQDAAQDPRAGRRRPRLGDDPLGAADLHLRRHPDLDAGFLRPRLAREPDQGHPRGRRLLDGQSAISSCSAWSTSRSDRCN